MAKSLIRKSSARHQDYKFIGEFTNKSTNTFCPKFYILHQAVGCPYMCSYCYLRVLLNWGDKMSPRWYENIEDLVQEVRFWMEQHKEPCSLNAGSVCDALAVDTNYLEGLIPLFAAQNTHHLNILSKAGIRTGEALKPITLEPTNSVAFAWTINCDAASERYERHAPTPVQRLKLAKLYNDCGWPIRYRIDPVFPIDNWKQHYGEFIKGLADKWARPDVITIGSIRALAALKSCIKDEPYNPALEYRGVMEYDKEFRHYRMIDSLRYEMYDFLVTRLREAYGKDVPPIALCKETNDMCVKILGSLPSCCNCTKLA